MAETNATRIDPADRDNLLETAQMLLLMLGEKSPHLKKRSERLANLCANFGESLGLDPDEEIMPLYLAALLQNIGLISLPNDLLPKPHALSDDDSPDLKRHPVVGVAILAVAPRFEILLPVVRHHHEAFDGSGYPDGLSGTDIPLGARIIHLCDCFDELAAPASSSSASASPAALEILQSMAGKRFDPGLLPPFVKFIESGGGGGADDFQARQKTVFIRQSLTAILPQIRSGKVVPPAMPRVAWELRNLVKRSQVSLQQVCWVIERDPVISARLVSIANSPAYRGLEEIKNIQTAVPRMGYREVLSVVVTIAHKSIYDVKQAHFRVLMDKMWVHSLACAYGSKLLAQHLRLPEPETVFLMGLTHDIGKAVLLRAFCEQRLERNLDTEAVVAAIQELHLKVGEIILRRWGFGEDFIKVAALHERDNLGPDTVKEVLIVHLVNRLVRQKGLSLFEWDGVPAAKLSSAVLLGVTPEVLEPIEAALKDLVRDVAHLF